MVAVDSSRLRFVTRTLSVTPRIHRSQYSKQDNTSLDIDGGYPRGRKTCVRTQTGLYFHPPSVLKTSVVVDLS